MVTLLVMLAESSTPTVFQRLNEFQRLRVSAALAILIVAAALLVLFIRAWSRLVRWYMHPATKACGNQRRMTPASTKPLDRRPRVARNDRQHWGSGR